MERGNLSRERCVEVIEGMVGGAMGDVVAAVPAPRSPSPQPRAVRRPFYAVRADPSIVGRAGEGGAFGIHRSWDEVARFAWKGTDAQRAAMAGNYERFQTEGEARVYLETERQDFVSRKQAQKILRAALIALAVFVCLTLTSVLSNCLYDALQCSGDWFGTRLECTGLKKVLSIAADYQLSIMMATGTAFTVVVGILANKVINQVVKSVM